MQCEVLLSEVGIDAAIFGVLTLDELVSEGTCQEGCSGITSYLDALF
jgi:hypothetical protein